MFISLSAHALTVCTMTFNSADEKAVLKSVYNSSVHKHIELVPNNKDPHWFKKACQSRVRCDVLLLSGHFGGMFFGEKSSSLLGLDELEKASCDQSCDGILGAKEVYLMGCNTLATKTPDHRSIGQYLQVLVQDGFPRNLAEEVVASRYVNYGLGISERMSIAFRNSQELFGFSSTGPLGAVAAPKLRRALQGSSSTPLRTRLQNSFSGSSFRVVNPKSELSDHDFSLQCGARSSIQSEKKSSFDKILSDSEIRRHFDLVLRNVHDVSVQNSLRAIAGDPITKKKIVELASSIQSQSHILIGARFQVLKVLRAAGIISSDEASSGMNKALDQRLSSGLDTIVLDQVCSIAQSDSDLVFKAAWLNQARLEDQSYWARLYGCFKTHQESAYPKLVKWLTLTKSASVRREILRSMKNNWSQEDRADLLSLSRTWSGRDRFELQESLGSSSDKNCNSSSDDQNWNCFNRLKPSFKNISDCQNATSGFKTESGLGADWYCLQQFPQEIHLSACINAGKKYSNAEKSDDFLQYCWDQLRTQKAVNRSECAGFGQAMRIKGNKIKQNWNCMNQVRDS
jgi:hypothetical protein